jgi:hypothetical protein
MIGRPWRPLTRHGVPGLLLPAINRHDRCLRYFCQRAINRASRQMPTPRREARRRAGPYAWLPVGQDAEPGPYRDSIEDVCHEEIHHRGPLRSIVLRLSARGAATTNGAKAGRRRGETDER